MKNQIILAIDDSQASLLLTKIIFQGYKNVEVIMEEDSTKAMSLIEKINPDLIFVDLMMPNIEGMDLLNSIKQHKVFKELPVIILSAVNSKEIEEKAMEAGASAFLHKPVDILEIKALAESLIELSH